MPAPCVGRCWLIGRRLVGVAICALVLNLASGCRAPVAYAEPPAEGPDSKASDLGLVPANATAFAQVRVSDWLATPAGKIIKEQLLDDTSALDAEMQRSWGVKASDLECLTMFTQGHIMGLGAPPYRYYAPTRAPRPAFSRPFPRTAPVDPERDVNQVAQFTRPRPPRDFDPDFIPGMDEDDRWGSPVAIVTTNKGYSQDKVLAALAPDPRQVKVGDKIVWVSREYYGRVIHFINDRNYAYSSGGSLVKYLKTPPGDKAKSPLAPAFKLAEEKHHVAVGFAPTKEMIKNMREEMPWPLRGFQSLTELQCGALTFDANEQSRLRIQLTSENEEKAQKTERAAKVLMDYFALMLEENVGEVEKFAGKGKLAELYKQVYGAAGRYSIERSGATVNIEAKLRIDGAMLEAAAAEFAAKAADRMNRARSRYNLYQIGIALHNYHNDLDHFPRNDKFSWRVALLPYLEERETLRGFNLEEAWDSPHNLKAAEKMPKVFASPGVKTDKLGMTYYRGFSCSDPQAEDGLAAVFDSRHKRGLDFDRIKDGTSNTLMVVEADQAVFWTKPQEIGYDPKKAMPKVGGVYKDGFHVLMADGANHFLSKNIKDEVLLGLITIGGGENIKWSEYLLEERDRRAWERYHERRPFRDPGDFDEASLLSPMGLFMGKKLNPVARINGSP